MERRITIGAVIIFLVAFFFLAINFYFQNTIEKAVRDGSYTEGIVGQPTFINPLMANLTNADQDLIEIIYSSLDNLVKNYQISEDNKSWTITLKEDLFWSDGEAVSADDVLFTIETIQNPVNNSPFYSTWQGIIAERLNENEIRLTLKTPYVFLIDNFKELKIVPRHIFGVIPVANLRLSQYNLEPIGSGPYKFKSLKTKKDGFITDYHLVINDLYHSSKPYMEELNFKFYDNENDLIKAFNKREIDGLGGLNQKYLDNIKVGYQILTINLPRYYAIFFNHNTSVALEEKAVRTALNLTINKDKIVKEIFDDQTIIMNGPLPPNVSGYDPKIYKEEIFNPEKAADLLEQAGWTVNKENVRMKIINKTEVSLEFDMIVPQIPFLAETANIIKKDWADIGVKLNAIVLNPNDINNSVIKTRDYQMIIFGNILKKNPDLFSFWHSSQSFYPGRNLALYNNKKVDDLLENIRQDFNSHSRNEKLSKLQQIIYEDQPAVFLFSPNYLYIVPKNLKGFRSYFISTPANRFEKISQWHLKTARVFQ